MLTISLVACSCGTADRDPSPSADQSAVAGNDIDRTVTVNGQSIHAVCSGAGPVTVVLVPGMGEDVYSMSGVRRGVSGFARACTYDRPGIGTSGPPAHDQTFATQADDLHVLLGSLEVTGPVVLVGHSLGGPQSVTYANAYPEKVVGLVLLDATPTTWLEILKNPPVSAPAAKEMSKYSRWFTDPTSSPERFDGLTAFAEVAKITSLGDLPLVVDRATHGHAPLSFSDPDQAAIEAAWLTGQKQWASLSSRGELRSVDSSHSIQREKVDLVIGQVRSLVEESVAAS